MSMPLLFDVSGGELIVILLFVLLFFGSKGIPDIARTMGRTMRQVRDASNEVQREIQRGANDVRRTMEEQRRSMLDQEASTEVPPSTSQDTSSDPNKPA
jgi:sec-independent protein translocase protein TatA